LYLLKNLHPKKLWPKRPKLAQSITLVLSVVLKQKKKTELTSLYSSPCRSLSSTVWSAWLAAALGLKSAVGLTEWRMKSACPVAVLSTDARGDVTV
jgi:hypothetical protein